MNKWEWSIFSAEHLEHSRSNISLDHFSEHCSGYFFIRIGPLGTIRNEYHAKYISFYFYHCYGEIGDWYYKDYLYFTSVLREIFGDKNVNVYNPENIFDGRGSTVDSVRKIKVFNIGRFEVNERVG